MRFSGYDQKDKDLDYRGARNNITCENRGTCLSYRRKKLHRIQRSCDKAKGGTHDMKLTNIKN